MAVMGDVINLRTARKAKTREDAAKRAASNRAKFGRTKAEKLADKQDKARSERTLEGAKLSDD
jgi:hypothetical protein